MKKILLALFLLPTLVLDISCNNDHTPPKPPDKPLLIVNGVQYDSSIYSIDPIKVKSITILKDAAATKKYGERGANGVIEFELSKP